MFPLDVAGSAVDEGGGEHWSSGEGADCAGDGGKHARIPRQLYVPH